jgi:hypothetical protein
MKPAVVQARPAPSIRHKIEYAIAAVLRRFGLYSLVHTIYGRLFKKSRKENLIAHSADFRPTKLAQLTPYARKIYANLKVEISQRKRGGN